MNPRALADAVEAQAGTSQAFATFRSVITSRPATGYIVLWFAAGTSQRGRYTGQAAWLRWQFRVTCVGYSDAHCLFVAEKVRALFVGFRPDPSPAASPLNEVDDDPPLIRDEVEGDVRYSVALRFALHTPITP